MRARIALVFLLAAGCELDIGDLFDTSDATDSDSTDTDTEVDTPIPYHYVRIDDLSDGGSGDTAGADIDAVALIEEVSGPDTDSSGFQTTYVAEVMMYSPEGEATGDPAKVLGEPDASDISTCTETGWSVSLGGMGGQLILRFESAIDYGDTLRVHEVGDCIDITKQPVATEPLQVSVGTSPDPMSTWHVIATDTTEAVSVISVPQLPVVYRR